MGPETTFVFGKRKPFEEGLVREYERLHIGPKLSKESLDALRHLCASFSWRGRADPAIWESVTATIVFNNPRRIIICRILDDGPDNVGRIHLVRVEAVEINLELAGDLRDAVAPLLDPRAWSVEGPTNQVQRNATNTLAPCDTNLKLPAKPGTWSINGDSSTYGFQAEYGGNQHPQTPESSKSAQNNVLDITGTNPGSQAVFSYDATSNRSNTLPRRGNTPAIWAIPWVLSLIGMGMSVYYHEKFQDGSNALQEKKEEFKSKVKNLTDVHSGENSKLESEKAKLAKDLSSLEEKNRQLEKDLATTEKKLSNAEKNGVLAATGDTKGLLKQLENEKDKITVEKKELTKKNKDYEKILDGIKDGIKTYNNLNKKSPLEGKPPGQTRHKLLPSKDHLTVVYIPPRKESFVFDSHFFCFIGLEHV